MKEKIDWIEFWNSTKSKPTLPHLLIHFSLSPQERSPISSLHKFSSDLVIVFLWNLVSNKSLLWPQFTVFKARNYTFVYIITHPQLPSKARHHITSFISAILHHTCRNILPPAPHTCQGIAVRLGCCFVIEEQVLEEKRDKWVRRWRAYIAPISSLISLPFSSSTLSLNSSYLAPPHSLKS